MCRMEASSGADLRVAPPKRQKRQRRVLVSARSRVRLSRTDHGVACVCAGPSIYTVSPISYLSGICAQYSTPPPCLFALSFTSLHDNQSVCDINRFLSATPESATARSARPRGQIPSPTQLCAVTVRARTAGFPAAKGWGPTTGWARPQWPGRLKHFGSDATPARLL